MEKKKKKQKCSAVTREYIYAHVILTKDPKISQNLGETRRQKCRKRKAVSSEALACVFYLKEAGRKMRLEANCDTQRGQICR